MIMITDHDLLSYVIFDQQLKITFRKSTPPLLFYSLPPKYSKSGSPTLLANIENFSGPPCRKGGGRTVFPVIQINCRFGVLPRCNSAFIVNSEPVIN